ncbi:hypothetical protein IGB42_04302 [Andreprevotia sp. IGB-42]|nr:hypothetical protein IGB42_04302 [Andreprevotia sp. IGB-42]
MPLAQVRRRVLGKALSRPWLPRQLPMLIQWVVLLPLGLVSRSWVGLPLPTVMAPSLFW